MQRLKKALKILAVIATVLACMALFVWMNGLQYVLAAAGGFSKPYFDPAAFANTPNCGGAQPCRSGPLRVMSYNVLCRICDKEGYDPWALRLPHLKAVIDRYGPDLLGLQELGGNTDIAEFLSLFPEYACAAYAFGFGFYRYADAALFYRTDRFEALDQGQMWLNPKPTLPFGFAWKPLSMPRYVNWVYLRQKNNGFRFLFVNTHFDNNGPNKEPSAPFFAETFRPIARHVPIIVTGDFNTNRQADRFQRLLNGHGEPVFANTMDLAPAPNILHNIPPGKDPRQTAEYTDLDQTIDHILLAGPQHNTVLQWIQDATLYPPEHRWPSDHPAVFTEILLEWPQDARPAESIPNS